MTLSPHRLPRVRREMVKATRGAQGFTDTDISHDVNRLLAAELYWVTRDMTALALDASADLPEWTPAVAAPSRFGMLVWEGGLPTLPWTGAPDRGFHVSPLGARVPPQARVDGVVWGPEEQGIMLHLLTRSAPLGDLLTPRWAACELFTFGAVALPALDPLRVEDLVGNAAGFVATVAATWILMQQPTIAESRPLREPAASRTSVAQQRPDRQVRIVDLRHAISLHREPGDGDATGRVYRHRWLVRGHWRQQAVGPGRTHRRPTYVPAYVKGPDGAPMLDSEHVNVWRR